MTCFGTARSSLALLGSCFTTLTFGCSGPADGTADPALLGEAEQAVMVGTQMDCDALGTCTARNMPTLNQTHNMIDEDVRSIMGPGGCYDASITAVLTTALANRTSTGALAGRSLTWNNIQAGNTGSPSFTTTTRDYERLSQQYRWAMQHHGPPDKQVPGVEPFYFHEMLDDFGGTKVRFPTSCNPKIYKSCHFNTGRVTNQLVGAAFWDLVWASDAPLAERQNDYVGNDYIKDLMNRGFSTMIAFMRYTPVAEPMTGGFRIRFNFTNAPHKVAFIGHQQHADFPLRVMDVGSGAIRNATVTTDARKKTTYAGKNLSEIREFVFPNGKSKQPYMFYADADADNVNFVEHIDALSLGLPLSGPVRQAFSGGWGTGWSSLMPFVLNGEACQIAYNKTTGAVHFDKFFPNAQGANTVWSWTWGSGFTHFVPYYIGGHPYFLVYNSANGELHFDTFPSNLQGPIIKGIRSWPAGFTSLTPFVMSGQNYVLFYNKNSGAVRIDRISSDGSNATNMWSSWWGTGFTDFLSYPVAGHPYLVAYNSSTGLVHYDRINESLFGVQVKTEANIGSGRKLAPLAFNGPFNFLSYAPGTGAGSIRRTENMGENAGEAWSATLLGGATSIVPFRQDGKSFVLVYNSSTGGVRAYELELF